MDAILRRGLASGGSLRPRASASKRVVACASERCIGQGVACKKRARRRQCSVGALPHVPAAMHHVDELHQVAQALPASLSGVEQLFGKIGFGSLLATTGIYWGKAAYGNVKEHGVVETSTMGIANLALAFLLLFRWIDSGHFPLSNMYESLLFLSWGISAVHLYMGKKVPQSGVAGTLTSPTALAILSFATLVLPPELQKATALVPALKSNWLFMHVSVMMMSYATLLVGSLMSIGYLLIDGVGGMLASLGGDKMEVAASSVVTVDAEPEGDAVRVDASANGSAGDDTRGNGDLLETCDDLAYRSIGLGFAFLTIGIISGAVWANEAWGSYWSWDPKETWALVTWLFYAIYLHGRIYKDWTPKTTAMVSAGGFAVVWMCYVGVNLFGVGLHSYGFFAK